MDGELPAPRVPPGPCSPSRLSPWGPLCPLSRWQQPSPARRLLCAGAAPAARGGCRIVTLGALTPRGDVPPGPAPKNRLFMQTNDAFPQQNPNSRLKVLGSGPSEFFLRLVWLWKMTLGSREAPEEAARGGEGRIKKSPPSLRLRVPPGWGWEKPEAALEKLRGPRGHPCVSPPLPPRPQVLTAAARSDRADKIGSMALIEPLRAAANWRIFFPFHFVDISSLAGWPCRVGFVTWN